MFLGYHFTKDNYWKVIILSWVLICNSCKCGNDKSQSMKNGGSVGMKVSPTKLNNINTPIQVIFTVNEKNKRKKVDLNNFKLKIKLVNSQDKETRVNYKIITSPNSISTIKQVKDLKEEVLSDLFNLQEFNYDQELEVSCSLVPGEKENHVILEFQLLDAKEKVIQEAKVAWNRELIKGKKASFLKLVYDSNLEEVIYNIRNEGDVDLNNLNIHYTNMNAENKVTINGKNSGIIPIGLIKAGDTTDIKNLIISFPTKDLKSKINFEIKEGEKLLDSKIVEIEQALIRLVPIEDKDGFKTDKVVTREFSFSLVSNGNIDKEQLKIQIKDISDLKAQVMYKFRECKEINGVDIDDLRNTINITIIPGQTPALEFTLQLMYANKKMGSGQVFTWKATDTPLNAATAALFEAIHKKENIESVLKNPDIQLDGRDDKHGSTVLHAAATSNNEILNAILDKGLNKGLNIGAKDGRSMQPSHHAILWGNTENLATLLNHGADIHATDWKGNTPLHYGVYGEDRLEIMNLLVEKGANVNASNNKGETILHFAAQAGNTPAIHVLLNHGAEINATDSKGATSLHHAALKGGAMTIFTLLESGADINIRDKKDRTALHWAAKNAGKRVMFMTDTKQKEDYYKDIFVVFNNLLAKGAEVNAQDNQGYTAIHNMVMSYKRYVDNGGSYSSSWLKDVQSIIKELISRGADINLSDKEGNTPLHTAISEGLTEFAKLLIDERARVNIANKSGKTSRELAIQSSNIEIRKLVNG